MLGKSRLIRSIKLENFLSYGSPGTEISLDPLNVLIGPNASGKSNLIEALALLRATPRDLTAPIREGGGVAEWLWKGSTRKSPVTSIEVTVDYPDGLMPLRHRLAFTAVGQRFELTDEVVENEGPQSGHEDDVYFFYRYQNGHPALNVRTVVSDPAGSGTGRAHRGLQREELAPDQSVLSQRKDPDQYPEITYLAEQFAKIRLYREWNMGRYTAPRVPQQTDLPEDFLTEDGGNLGLVVNDLQHRSGTKRLLIERLRTFYDGVEDLTTKIHGGTVQLFLHEKGLKQPIPATRLSDGILRYLSLLTILLHPTPPPLVCIEEPELGLHPDVLPTVAEMLVEASHRTQLVVTTHSDALVSALTETPETVLVCERDEDGTRLRRLDRERLKKWLDDYSLGDLWRMGEIGGTRW